MLFMIYELQVNLEYDCKVVKIKELILKEKQLRFKIVYQIKLKFRIICQMFQLKELLVWYFLFLVYHHKPMIMQFHWVFIFHKDLLIDL